MQNVAVAVAQDLDFDMPGAAHEALDENGIVAEGGSGFAARLFQPAFEIGRLIDYAHAAAAAAEGRLDDQREADLRRHLGRLFGIADGLLGAGDHADAGLLRQAPGGGLIAQKVQQFRAGADEGDAGALAGARQRRIFGQEAVAGMDGVDLFFGGQRNDALHVQVRFHRALACADQVGLVGLEAVQGQAIFLRINGHGAQAQFIGRAQNANGDFAAVQS